MKKVTFLGPVGATFSHEAYEALAKAYGGPTAVVDGPNMNCVPASNNGEIIKMICQHGGYGAIAMETLAEGRVIEPLESFIELLRTYPNHTDRRLRIVGAMKIELQLCLMAAGDLAIRMVKKVLAHPKALGACKRNMIARKFEGVQVSSNGEAARRVAEDPRSWAAIGPWSAANKYGLGILHPSFQDDRAVTTFFLLAPPEHPVAVGKENRALIVFAVPHKPGGLVRSLIPFEQEGLNLIQIHSVHVGNHTYNFAIEVEVGESQLGSFERAMKSFGGHVKELISFGPFEVIER